MPVLQLHGSKDLVLPISRARPDRVVAGAGHLVNHTHPEEVNAFLREALPAV